MTKPPESDHRWRETKAEAQLKYRARIEPQQREYERNLAALETLSSEMERECLRRCKANRIEQVRAIPRVKKWKQVLAKIQSGRIDSWDMCPDLVGVKLVVLSKDLINPVLDAVGDLRMSHGQSSRSWHSSRGRSRGHSAEHLQVRFPKRLKVPGSLATVGAELQVQTELQGTWDSLTHKPFYKPPRGAPAEVRNRVHRLAAAIDLLDQEMSDVRAAVGKLQGELEDQVTDYYTKDSPEWRSLKLDEVTLLAASGRQLKDPFNSARNLARKCGFRRSIWPERVRLGEESDDFLAVCEEAGFDTLGKVEGAAIGVYGWEDALRALANAVFLREGERYALYDRPLHVIAITIILARPWTSTPFFRPVIMREIARIAAEKEA